MRKRSLMFLPIVVMLALALPGTTLAGGSDFTYNVQKNTCTTSGGDYGYGWQYFKVKLTEWGNSGANKFTFTGKAQHKSLGSSRWYTDWNYGTFTWWFNDDGSNNWYERWYTFDPNDFAWHRVKVTLKVWHNNILLAKRTLLGKTC